MSDVERPKIKIRKWTACTDRERKDVDFLLGMIEAYRESVHDYENNPEYVRFLNARDKLEDAAVAIVQDTRRMSDEDKRLLVCKILDPFYRNGFAKNGTKLVLKITDPKRKLVSSIDSRPAIEAAIEQAIADEGLRGGVTYHPMVVRELCQYWLLYGEKIPNNLVTYAGFDTEVWAYGRANKYPEEGPMPTWKNFLARMNDPEAFAAWIYGVASKLYSGRQVMWLHGAEGLDGKTFVQKLTIEQLFEHVNAAMNNSALSEGSSRFMQADFENKALAFWDDCNNQMALLREDIKQLSSGGEGNPTRIEKKGAQAYTAQLETRLWINSNYAPTVPNDQFIRSRLLYIKLAPLTETPDLTLKQKFIDELPAFLYYGKQCFDRVCKDHRKIEQTQEAYDQIDQLVIDHEAKFREIFERRFVETEGTEVRCSNISEVLKREGVKANQDISRFYEWMENRLNLVKQSQVAEETGKKVQVVKGISFKPGVYP